MLPLGILALASGTLLTGAGWAVRKRRSALPQQLHTEPAAQPAPSAGLGQTRLQTVGAELRALTQQWYGQAQHLVQERRVLLFGNQRSQQLQALRSTSGTDLAEYLAESAATEAELDRHLWVAGTGTALAAAGLLTHSGLGLLSVPFTLYTCLPLVKVVYQGVTQEKRLRGPVVDLVAIGAALSAHYYTLTAASCALMCAAEKLVYRTQDRSHHDLLSIFQQQEQPVWLLREGVEVAGVLTELQPGDTLVVRAGEIIAVDGVITHGAALVDQHLLTGEAQPVEKGLGDPVLAATLLLTGRIEVRVEQAGSATLTAQIGAVLHDITDYRERQELRCDETADRLVLPTLTAGALTLVRLGRMSALTVMGANFTETLRVAYPLGALSYLNLAAQQGILIKDGRALERLSQVDTVIFDKTGTLTLDQPHVAALHPRLPFSSEQLLTYAAAAEFRQNHPLARAILAAAEQRQLPLPLIDEAAYVVGFGIKVRLRPSVGPNASTQGHHPAAGDSGLLIRVGSARFMAQEGLVLPAELVDLQQRCHEQGHSLVYVALGDQLAGALELHATVRPEVQNVVQQLRQRGLQLYIISGDQPQPTQHLAAILGVDNYFAEVLPADKARYVEQLQRAGRTVCFIGDGINDAVALKQADVSMSVRGATTVATNIAQIIFMDQSLHQLGHLFELGHQLDANLKRSLAAMLVPSGINLVGALFFRFSIRSAIVLFNASLLAGVTNALAPLLTQTRQAPANAAPSSAAAVGIPTFPHFKRLTVADRAEIEQFTQRFPPYSQLTFPSLLAYDIADDTEICWLHGNLVVRLLDFTTRQHFYSFLGTTQVRTTIEQLLARAEQEGIIDELLLVPEATLLPDWDELEQHFTITADRACFDYILAADLLCQLASNPSHPKAKDLRKFQRTFPTAVATEIDLRQPSVQAAVQQLFSTWADKRQKAVDEIAVEATALTRLLRFADQLTLVTVGVYLDGQLMAFTINEIVHDGYYIGHFGKADPAYRGLGLYAECETAKVMRQAGCLYLNYEEDLGHPGLRTYKAALQPIGFLKKYTVRTKPGSPRPAVA